MASPLAPLVFAALLGQGAATPDGGGGLGVSPVILEISAAAPTAVVRLTNGAAEAKRFELAVFAWSESESGEMQLAPTRDLVFHPQLVTLRPGEGRNVRIAAAIPFAAIEKTYRMFIEELPPAPRATGVQVLTRVGVPIFLAPARPERRATLDDLALSSGRLRFALRNEGTVRVRPHVVRAVALARDGTTVLEKELPAWYVLGGAARRYELEVDGESCARVAKVIAEARTDRETLTRELDVATGACGP